MIPVSVIVTLTVPRALLRARGALRENAYLERRMMIIHIVQMLSRLCGQSR